MKAKLFNLLDVGKLEQIYRANRTSQTQIDLCKNIEDLTVKELGDLGFILIEPDRFGIFPECILPVEVLTILHRIAMEKDIQIF